MCSIHLQALIRDVDQIGHGLLRIGQRSHESVIKIEIKLSIQHARGDILGNEFWASVGFSDLKQRCVGTVVAVVFHLRGQFTPENFGNVFGRIVAKSVNF